MLAHFNRVLRFCLVPGLALTLSASALAQSQQQQSGTSTQTQTKTDTAKKTKPANQNRPATKQATPKPAPKPKRIVSISGGRTRLNSRHWPLLGKPDAKYIFVEMFDYTCPHCKNTHKAVSGAFKALKDDLAILALPVPLSAACNSSVRVTNAKHAEACEIARIAVGVWRCNPAKFHEFHDWMFEAPIARTAFEARRKGEQMVGKPKLDKELARPYASQYLAKHVQLYQRAGAGTVPKLLFPRSTINGEIVSPNTLINIIQQQLGSQQAAK